MGGLSTTAKYIIHATIEIDGIVEKPDVIGALFGQTEGLLGEELDLRELQKTGRIGRIKVKLENKGGKSIGSVTIPSNLDRVETAIIAAAIESVDKVGPYNAKITVTKIEDIREKKRKWIIERAKELLRRWEKTAVETKEITEEVLKAVRVAEITKWGPEQLPAGPAVDGSDTVIVVEGRADVINLLKHGYKNVIAVEGVSIPKSLVELSKRKTLIAFVDGDRGGELILRELMRKADIDYVARAPPGREVEELTGKEIAKALKSRIPAEEYMETLEKERGKPPTPKEKVEAKPAPTTPPVEEGEIIPPEPAAQVPKQVLQLTKELEGTLEAVLFDENWQPLKRTAVRDLVQTIKDSDGVYAVVFDGIITQRIVDAAFEKGIRLLIAARIGEVLKKPEDVTLATFDTIAPLEAEEAGEELKEAVQA